MIPLAIAGVAAGVYYFYKNGQGKPVSVAPVALTNPDEWIDFKVRIPCLPLVPFPLFLRNLRLPQFWRRELILMVVIENHTSES